MWLTGLSGSGKTTIAQHLKRALDDHNVRCCVLDGDDLRKTLSADLGFSAEDRLENMRRVAEVAKLFVAEGYLVIVALISPRHSQRAHVRSLFNANEYVEVFVDAPLSVCEARDPKGLYEQARANKLKLFTGIDDLYEPPNQPELHLHTDRETPETLVDQVLTFLNEETTTGTTSRR